MWDKRSWGKCYTAHGSALHLVNDVEDLIVTPSFLYPGHRHYTEIGGSHLLKQNFISKWLSYIYTILIIQMCIH